MLSLSSWWTSYLPLIRRELDSDSGTMYMGILMPIFLISWRVRWEILELSACSRGRPGALAKRNPRVCLRVSMNLAFWPGRYAYTSMSGELTGVGVGGGEGGAG